MMQWVTRKDINDRSDLPQDSQFLGLWKGAFCLFEYDEEEDLFCMANQPSCYEVTTLPKERESKITHICILEYPKNY